MIPISCDSHIYNVNMLAMVKAVCQECNLAGTHTAPGSERCSSAWEHCEAHLDAPTLELQSCQHLAAYFLHYAHFLQKKQGKGNVPKDQRIQDVAPTGMPQSYFVEQKSVV